MENFIRFLQAPVRVGSQGSHPTGAWAEVLDAGYTQLLPTTRAVLSEYYRNQEFFENWLATRFDHPTAPPVPALPWHWPASVPARSGGYRPLPAAFSGRQRPPEAVAGPGILPGWPRRCTPAMAATTACCWPVAPPTMRWPGALCVPPGRACRSSTAAARPTCPTWRR